MIKNITLLLLIIIGLTSNAQTQLTPSKKSFDKKWIRPVDYQMNWYAQKDTTKIKIGNVTTQISMKKSTLIIVTKVNLKNVKDLWVDSTVANLKNLRPIRHSSYNGQRDMALVFGKIVTGFYNDKIKNNRTIIKDTTNSEYFDSNIYPILIGWLPLKNNYKQDISIYDYNPSSKIGVLKASIRNVSSGTYQSDKNGIRNVWIVQVSDEIGSDVNGMSTYYFDKEDRKLWKQEMNSKGRKMIMLREE